MQTSNSPAFKSVNTGRVTWKILRTFSIIAKTSKQKFFSIFLLLISVSFSSLTANFFRLSYFCFPNWSFPDVVFFNSLFTLYLSVFLLLFLLLCLFLQISMCHFLLTSLVPHWPKWQVEWAGAMCKLFWRVPMASHPAAPFMGRPGFSQNWFALSSQSLHLLFQKS